jgi:predicted permease
MGTLLRDLSFALRMVRKSPGFAFATILTLAVAIGANTVALGVFDALILRPVNVPHAESLYEVSRINQANESYPGFLDLRDRNRSFDALAAVLFAQEGLDTGGGASLAWGYKTSGNYFDVLGIQPYLGRFFHPSDENGPNSAPYVVLTYAYWHTHLHDDHGVVGRSVRLSKRPVTVIGVAPPGFQGTLAGFSPSFITPIMIAGADFVNTRGDRPIDKMMGHLKAGITPAQATADLNSIGSWMQKTYPRTDSQAQFLLSRPGLGDLFGGALRAFVGGLGLLAALILLAACANLGSLFTSRAADRSREIAMRLALGARRLHVVRQLLTEALLISILGGAGGLWGSVMLLNWLSEWQPFPEFPVNVPVSPDIRVYVVALLLAVASGFLFGAAPIRQVFGTDPYAIVKLGSRATPERRLTVRDLLLGVQIAICAVLLTSSLVAVRGMIRSIDSHLGIDPQNAMLVRIDPTLAGYQHNRVPEIQQRVIDAVKTIAGVKAAGVVGEYPPLHMGWNNTDVFAEKTTDLRPENAAAAAIVYEVSPEYFVAAGTTLLFGRAFTLHDDENSPRVAIVNRVFAGEVFGSQTAAIGSYYKMKDGVRIQVVGIVEDGKYTANLAEDPQAAMFLPILQSPSDDAWLVVRSNRESQLMAAAIRGQLRNLDSALPLFMQTWNQEMSGALFAPRMAALSLGVLGFMGAVLSITGIFAMAARSVSRRNRELAIRIALGAGRNEILCTALGRAIKLLASGSAVGLILAFLASRVLSAIVYQATPRDPVVLAGVVLAMASLGLLATWIPAQRTLSLDPVILLREE